MAKPVAREMAEPTRSPGTGHRALGFEEPMVWTTPSWVSITSLGTHTEVCQGTIFIMGTEEIKEIWDSSTWFLNECEAFQLFQLWFDLNFHTF